jgi:hypothetical protein
LQFNGDQRDCGKCTGSNRRFAALSVRVCDGASLPSACAYATVLSAFCSGRDGKSTRHNSTSVTGRRSE